MRLTDRSSRIQALLRLGAFAGALSYVPLIGQAVAMLTLTDVAARRIWRYLRDSKVNQKAKAEALEELIASVEAASDGLTERVFGDRDFLSTSLLSASEVEAFLTYAFSDVTFENVRETDIVSRVNLVAENVAINWFDRRRDHWKETARAGGYVRVIVSKEAHDAKPGEFLVIEEEYKTLFRDAVEVLRLKIVQVVDTRFHPVR